MKGGRTTLINRRSESGLATLIVLIAVMMASTVIAASYAWARHEVWSSRRYVQQQKALATARSAVGWGLHELLADTTSTYDWLGDTWATEHYPISGGDESMTVQIADEGSKLNLNGEWLQPATAAGVPASVISGIQKRLTEKGYIGSITELGALKDSARTFDLGHWFTTYGVYNINSLTNSSWSRLLKAMGVLEANEKALLDRIKTVQEYKRPDTVEEFLKQVGFSADLAGNLEPWLVADGAINVNTADEDVLKAVCKAAGIDAGSMLAQRKVAPFRTRADLEKVTGTLQGYGLELSVYSHVFKITSIVALQTAPWQATVEAVVTRTWDGKRNDWVLQIISWQEAVNSV